MGLDILDKIDCRAFTKTSFTPNDAVSKDAEVLVAFVEEDDDALFVLQFGRYENGDIGFRVLCAKWKSNLFEAELLETIGNEVTNGIYFGQYIRSTSGWCLPFIASR